MRGSRMTGAPTSRTATNDQYKDRSGPRFARFLTAKTRLVVQPGVIEYEALAPGDWDTQEVVEFVQAERAR